MCDIISSIFSKTNQESPYIQYSCSMEIVMDFLEQNILEIDHVAMSQGENGNVCIGMNEYICYLFSIKPSNTDGYFP